MAEIEVANELGQGKVKGGGVLVNFEKIRKKLGTSWWLTQ